MCVHMHTGAVHIYSRIVNPMVSGRNFYIALLQSDKVYCEIQHLDIKT